MRTRIRIGAFTFNDVEIEHVVEKHRDLFNAARTIAVYASSPTAYVLSIVTARATNSELIVIPTGYNVDHSLENRIGSDVDLRVSGFDQEKLEFIYEKNSFERSCSPIGGVYIFTSGTSGTPKLAKHTWSTIEASSHCVPERISKLEWYLAYEPASYAGLQVLFSALNSHGTIIIPEKRDIGNHINALVARPPDVISATPTWWRLVIGGWPSGVPPKPLHQATLGGEVVTQNDLDMVGQFFSPEQLTHIYASTEAGTAIIVSDRMAGFPAKWLNVDRHVKIRISDGILQILSKQRMVGYANAIDSSENSEWIDTKDLAEVRGDRCFVLGRADGLINVGGRKVRPEEIEGAISSVNGVVDSIVYAKKNPVTGSILAADVALKSGISTSVANIKAELAGKLPACKIPVYIRLVDKISVSRNDKKVRRSE